MTKVDKVKNIMAKRRQRSSADISGDKPGGSNFSKMGGSHSNSPVHQVSPGEHLGQRQDDRPKNMIPNKRARSSLGESRVCIFFSVLVISFLVSVLLVRKFFLSVIYSLHSVVHPMKMKLKKKAHEQK